MREVASQATAADAERAMSALLAAAEFVDFSDQTQAPVVQELMLTMRKLDQSGKTLAIIRALRDGPPRARQFAINSVGPFKNITTDKEFPALAEQVLIVAAGEDLWPRVIALRLLGETLAVTKLDPAAVSTEERREMVRQLAVNVPHDRVHQLVVTALNAKQIDVALAAEQFARLPAETTDAKVQAKLVEVLANVIKGKLGDVVASRDQRAQALTALISLNTRGGSRIPLTDGSVEVGRPGSQTQCWDQIQRGRTVHARTNYQGSRRNQPRSEGCPARVRGCAGHP